MHNKCVQSLPQKTAGLYTVLFFQSMRIASLLALFFLAAVVLQAPANAQQLSFSKKLCMAETLSNPATCPPPVNSMVAPGQAVGYVVSVQNLGPGVATIQFLDTFPPDFIQSGTPSCTQTDASGSSIPLTWPISGAGSFSNVPDGAKIVCTIPGYFSNPNGGILSQTNTVQMSTGTIDNNTPKESSSITVNNLQQLNVDISLEKTVDLSSVNISNNSQTVTYTITITNLGPGNATLGPYFQLHDQLALKPGTGSLNVTLGSQTCKHLDSSGAVVSGGSCLASTTQIPPAIVGTMAWQPFADWTFGSSNGYMAAGDSIELKYQVHISQVQGFTTCVPISNSGALLNYAFFDLQRTNGVTLTEQNPPNNFYQDNPPGNTSSMVNVTTNYQVSPNCAPPGNVVLDKQQVSPQPGGGLTWPATVVYKITIQNNYTVPITVGASDLITEGIDTPPFTSHWISTVDSSGNSFGTGISLLGFTWYNQQQQQWSSGSPITIAAGMTATITITFEFKNPDCDTVPNVNPKPIYNTAKIIYTDPSTSTQTVQYATATTDMAPPPPCHFVVTKQRGGRLVAGTNPVVHFGSPLIYGVTFANQGPPHTAALLDTVRITDASYAVLLPFTANWSCTASSGVTGYSPNGNVSNGSAVYTSLPAQGAVVMQMAHVLFPTNGTLTCTFIVTVSRPALTDPNCSTTPTYFENMALMDETWPYNVNVPFPPSGAYVLGTTSPSPQIQNWATVDIPLPKCFDAQVNKSVTAAGLPPGSLPWTSPAGPALNYLISAGNPTSFPLTGALAGSTWNGLVVKDTITPAGLAGNVSVPSTSSGLQLCVPGNWCATSLPLSPTGEVGIANIPAQSTATWNLVLNPTPAHLTPGSYITNCSTIVPSGSFTGPDWYSYYDPAHPPASLSSCTSVPVLDTATLNVTKRVVNKTNQPLPANYTINISCSPYQATMTTLTLLGNGPPQSITVPVASGEHCTVTEPLSSQPPLPQNCKGPTGVLGPGYWELPSIVPSGPIAISAPGQYTAEVLNVATCVPRGKTGSLTVEKEVTAPSGFTSTTAFPITVNCNGTVTQLSLTNSGTSTQFPLGPGEHCSVTETPPTTSFAAPKCLYGAVWDPPVYLPSQAITTAADQASLVLVTNRYHCLPHRIDIPKEQRTGPAPKKPEGKE